MVLITKSVLQNQRERKHYKAKKVARIILASVMESLNAIVPGTILLLQKNRK